MFDLLCLFIYTTGSGGLLPEFQTLIKQKLCTGLKICKSAVNSLEQWDFFTVMKIC